MTRRSSRCGIARGYLRPYGRRRVRQEANANERSFVATDPFQWEDWPGSRPALGGRDSPSPSRSDAVGCSAGRGPQIARRPAARGFQLLGVENMRMVRYEADATVTAVAEWGDPDAAFPVGSRLPLSRWALGRLKHRPGGRSIEQPDERNAHERPEQLVRARGGPEHGEVADGTPLRWRRRRPTLRSSSPSRKMPEPIMLPTTSAVAIQRPIERFSLRSPAGDGSALTDPLVSMGSPFVRSGVDLQDAVPPAIGRDCARRPVVGHSNRREIRPRVRSRALRRLRGVRWAPRTAWRRVAGRRHCRAARWR